MNHTHATVAVMVIALLASVSCGPGTGTVLLRNESGEAVSRVTLKTSWGETLEVTDLAPGKTAQVSYRGREGDYRVEVVFRSGRHLQMGEAPYVTTGIDFQDEIVVRSSEIQLRAHKPVNR